MRLPQLDDRLSKAAKLFPACAYGADIGADHGRLSCFLLANNRCARMCISDLSAPSLEKAKRLMALHGLAERADFAVGDGLQVLEQKADAIAVLGMGGKTIAHILQKGIHKIQGATLILSAHTEITALRRKITEIGYRLDAEDIARAGGRYYVIMRAVPGESAYSEPEMLLGPKLMETVPEEYLPYLKWRRDVLFCENTEEGRMNLKIVEEEIRRVGQSE